MKYCPICTRPVQAPDGKPLMPDGSCPIHTCNGYVTRGGIKAMQEHADQLAKEKQIYLEGWTIPPEKQALEPEKQKEPSKTRR